MNITQEMFTQQQVPRFGTQNPEWMDLPLWKFMVRNKESAYWARKHFSVEGDYPGWCFQRFGTSQTDLADGRVVYIAGEHEDYYDPDFYIYNDVIVIDSEGEITIWGYPKAVFPPTDFHSATLVDDKIVIIGSLGYMGERVPGFTPVYVLDTDSFQIERLETTGENPGWIFRHEAELDDSQTKIKVRGGKLTIKGHENELTNNDWEYQLNLKSLEWKKIV